MKRSDFLRLVAAHFSPLTPDVHKDLLILIERVPKMNPPCFLVSLAMAACFGFSAAAQNSSFDTSIPVSVNEWVAAGEPSTYNTHTVYDYLDGGAEVYLAYGMKTVRALRYVRSGEASIDLSIFEMEDPEGAFGAFTYERLDPEAGIGQGSEYGAGMLRFWQGRHFVFIQAEKESPNSREAILALGRTLASRLGSEAGFPPLVGALPERGLRPLTVRYAFSPLILKNLETTLNDNPLGLPPRAATVVGRYWKPGNPERILIASLPDSVAATKSVDSYLMRRFQRAGKSEEPFRDHERWNLIAASGHRAVLILEAPDAATARNQLKEIKFKLKEIPR
jgi:hypothetical protein